MDKEKLMNTKIDINENASDIIIKQHKGFKNEMTGACSENLADIVTDKRFIAIHEGEERGLFGIYGKYDERLDALFVITAKFIKVESRWEEVSRLVFVKTGIDVEIIGAENWRYESEIDICGQCVFGKSCGMNFVVSGFLEEAVKFFGGTPLLINDAGDTIRHDFMCLRDLDFIISDIRVGYHLKTAGVLQDNKPVWGDEMPVPDEAMRRMEVRMKGMELVNMDEGFSLSVAMHYADTSFLQKEKGALWHRKFRAVFTYTWEKDNGNIKPVNKLMLFEERRNRVRKTMPGDKFKDFIHVAPVYLKGSFKGTDIEYTSGWLKEYLKKINRIFREEDKPEEIWLRMKRVEIDCFEKHGRCSPRSAVYMPALLAGNPFIEKLTNIYADDKNPGGSQLMINALARLSNNEIKPEEFINIAFGGLEKEDGAPHEMIGIPKAMLDYAMAKSRVSLIKKVKAAFASKEERDYLRRMNKEGCRLLIDFMNIASIDELYSRLFAKLMAMRGYRGWENYIHYICSLSPEELKLYNIYLDIIASCKDAAKNAEWKIGRDDLKKVVKKWQESGAERGLEAYDAMIRHRQPILKEYVYEYGDFLATFPKYTGDIIEEGIKLHHCVKDFIGAVAEGRTDILFIRLKDRPDKPFFTLEVRNGAVRQCHGFANKNIDECKGLEEFLKKFCDEKNIIFSVGSRQMNV